jgi:hypothetical protein
MKLWQIDRQTLQARVRAILPPSWLSYQNVWLGMGGEGDIVVAETRGGATSPAHTVLIRFTFGSTGTLVASGYADRSGATLAPPSLEASGLARLAKATTGTWLDTAGLAAFGAFPRGETPQVF